jgi:hypothetical protein
MGHCAKITIYQSKVKEKLIQLKTYSDWSIYLDKYANGEDAILTIIQNSIFELDAGTTLRFYEKIQQSYTKRKKDIFNKFNRDITISSVKSNNDYILIFRNLNKLLSGLKDFVEIKAIPDDLKKILLQDLDDYIEDLKKRFSKIFINNVEVLSSVKSIGQRTNILNIETQSDLLNLNQSAPRKIIF